MWGIAGVIYLSGAEGPGTRKAAQLGYRLGILAQPGNTVHMRAAQYQWWAIDNGCFAQGERFNVEAFLFWLSGLEHRAHCRFAVAPDVLLDAKATLERSAPILPRMRAMGYRPALVAQNGLESLRVPWSTFDCLFIGGDTEWKLSDAAKHLTAEALKRRKWVHMGRVNSYKRLRLAADWGCHSADGTYLKYGPDVLLPKLLSWLDRINGGNKQCFGLLPTSCQSLPLTSR